MDDLVRQLLKKDIFQIKPITQASKVKTPKIQFFENTNYNY